jgi:hypothetical protein
MHFALQKYEILKLSCRLHYNYGMAKAQTLQIRLTDAEKDGFQAAANLSGIALSSWVRERLRLAAIRDLESAGQKVPFIPSSRMESSDG